MLILLRSSSTFEMAIYELEAKKMASKWQRVSRTFFRNSYFHWRTVYHI